MLNPSTEQNTKLCRGKFQLRDRSLDANDAVGLGKRAIKSKENKNRVIDTDGSYVHYQGKLVLLFQGSIELSAPSPRAPDSKGAYRS